MRRGAGCENQAELAPPCGRMRVAVNVAIALGLGCIRALLRNRYMQWHPWVWPAGR